jgi:hypothetical protein
MRRSRPVTGFKGILKPAQQPKRLIHHTDCAPGQPEEFMDAALLIPIIAIMGSFAIPITAIVMDYRRRQLQSEERRAMIERGMQPPPLEEPRIRRDPVERREKSLFNGITMLFLGIGLGVAAWLLDNVVAMSFIPKGLIGPLTVGAAVVGFIGLGNLVYFLVTAGRMAKTG